VLGNPAGQPATFSKTEMQHSPFLDATFWKKYLQKTAVKKVSKLIAGAPDTVYRIRVIHGYHRGNALQRALYDEFDYFHTSDRVQRMEGGSNPGITEIVLREW